MAKDANELHNETAHDIAGCEESQNDFGIFPDDGDEQAQENDGERRLAAGPGDVLEAVVANGAGHERAEGGDDEEPEHGPTLVGQRNLQSVHEGGDNAGGGGGGKAARKFEAAGM